MPLAGRPFRATLTGDESLRRRPLERVAAPLRAMGATLETTDGHAPLTITGGRLRGMTHELPVASAQVKTALLLAGLPAEGRTTVREPMPSRDHTERMLPAFGATVERDGLAASVAGGPRLRGTTSTCPATPRAPPSWWWPRSCCPTPSCGSRACCSPPRAPPSSRCCGRWAAASRCALDGREPEPVGTIVASSSSLVGTRIDPALVPSLIDEVPALAVAGAFA